MPSLEELAEQHSSQLSSVLKSAVETISSDQEITFRLYVRQVLPLDGFVYWVNAEIISCDELCRLNIESPTRLKIKGSLHRQVIAIQDESVSVSTAASSSLFLEWRAAISSRVFFIIAAWRFCQPCVPRLSTARRISATSRSYPTASRSGCK